MNIQRAIEVVDAFVCGERTQVPGLSHWRTLDNITACGVSSYGMVTDNAEHTTIDCPECVQRLLALVYTREDWDGRRKR